MAGIEPQSSYDRQAVLALGTDGKTQAAAAAVHDKAVARGQDSTLLTQPLGAGALGKLGAASRLTIIGAAVPTGDSVAGQGPEALARMLAGAGLAAVRRISLVADASATPPGAGPGFADAFHAALRHLGIETDLAARVGAVAVIEDGPDRGRKQTRDTTGPDWVNKRPRSKIVYGWSDGGQTKRWSDED